MLYLGFVHAVASICMTLTVMLSYCYEDEEEGEYAEIQDGYQRGFRVNSRPGYSRR